MNLETEVPTTPAADPAPATPDATPELSISDHEAEYPALSRTEREAEARKARASAPKTSELGTDGAPLSDGPADPDARDEKGRFRHRSAKQQASAADVPRINELTAKLRAAEAERDALKATRQPSSAPPVQSSAATAPPPAPIRTEAFSQSAPQFKDYLSKLAANETYDDAVQRHAEAVADWRWQKASHEQAQQAKQKEFYGGFEAKTKEAAKLYPDFQTVALDADSVIPVGSFIDSWVWEHPTGAHVLYHMQKHPADVARIHALPPFEQLSELSLLGQRLTTPEPRTAAAATGSAPAPVAITPAPRPPNPVRTGPVKAADAPLGDDATISDHEARFGSKRHRA